MRRLNERGVYEIHTNTMHYPATTQPTRARIEQVVDREEEDDEVKESTKFTELNPVIPRNFLVMDVYMESPPAGVSPASYDVPLRHSSAVDHESYRSADFLAPFQGLSAVSPEIRDMLTPEQRKAFDQAVSIEKDWNYSERGTEAASTSRRIPVVDKAIVPYSMSVS